MSERKTETTKEWATTWLDRVADGSNTMSQRKLSSIEKHEGGLEAVKAVATKKGVRLLLVRDDKGDEIVTASVNPFKVICQGLSTKQV